MPKKPWQQYQEDAAVFFRSIGLRAETDVRLEGIRTTSDIDVLVDQDIAGFTVRWIIECKLWKTPVNQLHVFGLREIVSDLGADRGIILCEAGFQSGALEASNLTNITLTSLAAMKDQAQNDIFAAKIADQFDRASKAREQYWEIPKEIRINCGLRGDFDPTVKNQGMALEAMISLLSKAIRAKFPISVSFDEASKAGWWPSTILTRQGLFEWLEPDLLDAEKLLADALGDHPEFKI